MDTLYNCMNNEGLFSDNWNSEIKKKKSLQQFEFVDFLKTFLFKKINAYLKSNIVSQMQVLIHKKEVNSFCRTTTPALMKISEQAV